MKAQDLIKEFERHNLGPYIEVPCSILDPIIYELLRDMPSEVINPASESTAMGLAAGSYLATGRIPVILMQNSGLCNAMNALTSLNQIYGIPVLLVISWRGEPGRRDAPEHYVMGKKAEELLEVLEVPYAVLSSENFKDQINKLLRFVRKKEMPAAILVKGETLQKEAKAVSVLSPHGMTMARAIDIIVGAVRKKAYLVTTNGFTSRETFYNLTQRGVEEKSPPFYMLGSMGHALSIGVGIAKYLESKKKVVVLDGDGGCLMQLGSMTSVGAENPQNLIHVVLDNGVYASTGGQPTISGDVDFCKAALGCGYKRVYRITNENQLRKILPGLLKNRGPAFVHTLVNGKCNKSPRVSDANSCGEIKKRFMRNIAQWRA